MIFAVSTVYPSGSETLRCQKLLQNNVSNSVDLFDVADLCYFSTYFAMFTKIFPYRIQIAVTIILMS